MKNLSWIFALLLTVGLFQSCAKEEPLQEEPPANLKAPEIPPMAMFTMPTESFDETAVDTSEFGSGGGGGPVSYYNWFHSAVNLVFWNAAIRLHMALPTAAFGAAVSQPAVYIGDLTFLWEYTYVAPPAQGNQTYHVQLTGQFTPDLEDVLWTLTVSQEGGFTDFVWYTGISSTQQNEGMFTLNWNPDNPQSYLQLDYSGDNSTGEGTLRFTNVVTGSPDFGQYIEYRERPADPYDRAFDVQGDPGYFLEIQWNEDAKDGRVRHPFNFGDDQWHCWDSNLMDVECL